MSNETANLESLESDVLASIDELETEVSLDDLDGIVQAQGALDVNEALGVEAEVSLEELDDIVNAVQAEEAPVTVEEPAQPASTLTVSDTTPAEPAAKEAAVEKPAKPAKRTPAGSKPSVALNAKLGEDGDKYKLTTEDQAISPEALAKHRDELVQMLDQLPVKCQKKAVNLISWLNGNGSLSVFIEMALKELISKGKLTTAELKARYIKRPYQPSTANAQTGNIFKTFDALNIASRNGDTMTINNESLVVKKAQKQFAAA